MGRQFGISGVPWEAILAPGDHPGGPWEQQDGHEVANDRICVDFGMTLGLVCGSFWEPKCLQIRVVFGFVCR